MRYGLFVLWMLFSSVPMATAQMSIGIEVPGASIGARGDERGQEHKK